MSLAVDFNAQLVMVSQKIFRQVLDSMARPGKVNRIEPFPMAGSDEETNNTRYLVGLGYTLLDVEAGFHVFQPEPSRASLAAELVLHTSSKSSPLDKADFIFMTGADEPGILTHVKCGNLDYPDTGATVIITIDYLSEQGLSETGAGVELILKGPGILGQKSLFVDGITEHHVQVLRDINAEFPLGIDVILVCENQLACIPRSVALDVRRN